MKTSAAMNTVLQTIARHQEHVQALATLDAAIAAQQNIITDAQVDHSAVDQLETQLQNALAQQAAGETPQAAPETLASQILKAKTDFEQAQAAAAVNSDLARHTIAGLERRRETLCQQRVRRDMHAALQEFLINEQDAAGRTYVKAADSLVNAYARIQALQRIATNHSPPLHRAGPPPFLHELNLIQRPQNMPLPDPVAYSPSDAAWLFNLPTLRALVEATRQTLVAEYRKAGLPL